MNHRRMHVLWCALLALAVLGVTVQAQPDPALKNAVDKMTADLAAGKTPGDKDVKEFVKKWNDLEDVMKAAFKPLGKKGPNLEVILNKLSKKASLTAAEKGDLIKIANVARAIAIVTPHYTEKTKGNAAKKTKWDKYTGDMTAGSKELLDAIKGGNGNTIKQKALKLSGSCTDCHGDFR